MPVERLLLARQLLPPLRNDQPVKTKASIKLAIGRNKGNKDKVVRRLEREATRRNGRHTTPSLTLKIVSGNEVVDLDDLVASAPLCGVRSYLNHRRQRPILTLLV